MLETIPTRPAVVNDSNEPTHPHGADPKGDDNYSRSDFRPRPSERFDRLRDVLERDGPDPVAEPEHVRAGIDHIEMVESQIINRGVHRARRGRRPRGLELESALSATPYHEQIEFRSGVRAPEIAFIGSRAEASDHFAAGKPLPRCANLRMSGEVFVRLDAKERVEESRVVHQHLRRFDLPLAEVFEPGLQLPNHGR